MPKAYRMLTIVVGTQRWMPWTNDPERARRFVWEGWRKQTSRDFPASPVLRALLFRCRGQGVHSCSSDPTSCLAQPKTPHSQTNKYMLGLVMLSSGKKNKTGKGDFISNGQRRLCDDSCVHHSDTEVSKSITISIRAEPWDLVGSL